MLDLRRCLRWIRDWQLWKHTTRFGLVWMLGWELGVLVWTVLACASALVHGAPSGETWMMFVALMAATGCHMLLTNAHEERRRVARLNTEYIDHTGIWTVAAAVTLPAHLMVGLVLVIRFQRYQLAHKPPVRVVFGTTAIIASCLATNAIAAPIRSRLTETLIGDGGQLVVTLLFAAAAVAYYVVQTVILGVARGVRLSWSWQSTIGEAKDNADFAALICLGLIAAMLLSVLHVSWAALIDFLAILWTRNARDLDTAIRDRDNAISDSITDPLTRLLNRRGFKDRARHLLTEHQHVGVLAFDLDHFKKVNDTYGHSSGDDVLIAVAEVLRANARTEDQLYRLGGEELMMILPGAPQPEVRLIAERMRKSVERIAVPATERAGGEPGLISISVSIGVAFHPTHGKTVDEVVGAADRALYEAKEAGRNCVVEASESLPPKPTLRTRASDR